VRENEQFFRVKSQRLAQPIYQRYRWSAAGVLDVGNMAGFDANLFSQIALRHPGLVMRRFDDRAERSFGHRRNSPSML